ncbi:MAG: hypothetical protein JSS02_18065, partial [Planctomycetes bacterium]|nr:hypothetical protein [Planctomycetota bacterium]
MDVFDWLSEILSVFSPRRAAVRLWHDVANWCDVRFTTPLAILAGLNCVAAVVFLRLQSPKPFVMNDSRLCGAAAGAALLAVFSRWIIRNCERVEPAFWIKALLAGLSVLPFAALFSIATPKNSLLAVAAVSALAVVAGNATMLWRRKVSRHTAHYAWGEKQAHRERSPHESKHEPKHERKPEPKVHRPAPVESVTPVKTTSPRLRVVRDDEPSAAPFTPPAALEPTRTGEWCERTSHESGVPMVHGCLIARFEPRQSLANVHIPFQPPFDKAPEFSFQIFDGGDVRARTPAVFRYGA